MPTAKPRCPICGKPTAAKFRPFCSKRCADIDLRRWFDGAYSFESEDQSSNDEE